MNGKTPSQNTEKDSKKSTSPALPEGVEPSSFKPEIAPAQESVPPPEATNNLGTHPSTQSNQPPKECPKEISVRIPKDVSLTDFERRSLILGWVTLLILVATFAVFYYQLRESKIQTAIFRGQGEQARKDALLTRTQTDQQIKNAADQFRIEERPYIWIQDRPKDDSAPMIGTDPSIGKFAWNIYYANFGKSPAIRFCREVHLVTGEGALKRVVDINHETCKSPSGGIIPPGKLELTSAFAEGTPSERDISQWKAMLNGIVVYGRFDYSDTLGGEYFSQFCMATQPNGRIGDCEGHNYIH